MIVDLIIKEGRGGLTHDINMTKGEKNGLPEKYSICHQNKNNNFNDNNNNSFCT